MLKIKKTKKINNCKIQRDILKCPFFFVKWNSKDTPLSVLSLETSEGVYTLEENI